jgi:S-phase kinase-associated protein 1
MVKDTDPGDTIPLASVGKEELAKAVEWMEKMAAFKAGGTSDEEQEAWKNGYKKTMAAQDQLPLLFKTMNAANFMNIKLLLDELCKFVAEMIAQRTPNEILDYFNIKKDATPEEEQELIATYKWIDPEGLIAKDREKRLAEKAKEAA